MRSTLFNRRRRELVTSILLVAVVFHALIPAGFMPPSGTPFSLTTRQPEFPAPPPPLHTCPRPRRPRPPPPRPPSPPPPLRRLASAAALPASAATLTQQLRA